MKKTYEDKVVQGSSETVPLTLEEKVAIDYADHFNSGPSAIKIENPCEKTKIKIIHKPFTHLDNTRIQKGFKIYNEFVQLVFKNKTLFIQN